jgi:hypothetical protein
MKELANSFAQLIAIIMITLVMAVSYAAVSQLGSADASSNASAGAQTPSLLVAGAH